VTPRSLEDNRLLLEISMSMEYELDSIRRHVAGMQAGDAYAGPYLALLERAVEGAHNDGARRTAFIELRDHVKALLAPFEPILYAPSSFC
jgi:hypothetical protein